MQEYKLPPRFVEVEPFHANDKIIRAAILFHLVDASEADILMSTVSNIPYNAITCSSPPYLYTLYKLIRAKRPGFPEMTKQEAEDGLAMFLGKHLYPSSFAKEQSLLNKVPSHFSNDQSLASGSSPPNNSVLETPTRHSNAENVSGNNLSTPRIALGPAEDGSIGFQNRSHPRAPIQPAQTIHHENARPAYRHPNRQGRNDTRNDYERMRDDGRDLARYPHEVIPENQSLARHQEQFYSFANMCGLNAQQGLDHLLIMIQPDSLAHSFYFSDIAQRLQDQLDDIHRHPVLLLEVLEEAVKEQPFFDMVQLSKDCVHPRNFFDNCCEAIRKQEIKDARSPTILTIDQSRDHHCSGDNSCKAYMVYDAFYASAGRRYGTDNRRPHNHNRYQRSNSRPSGSKNMKDRNGNVLKCRGCGSEYHFIRECPKVKKHHLIGLVMDKVTDAEDVKVADIFSVAQDLPDDVWESIHGGMKDSETPQEKSDDHLDQIMFARLATNSDISHIFHAEKAAELMTNPYQTFLKPNTTDAYETFVCKNASSVNITERLKSEVIKIMKEGSNEFEGIMIDNGAAKSPSGLKAYIRYCAHTNSTPQVRASNRAFRGVGHGVQESLGVVPIRMPLGNQHMISFEVDLVDQDIPLIFGLEQHMAHSCSTNEYFKTFTHQKYSIRSKSSSNCINSSVTLQILH